VADPDAGSVAGAGGAGGWVFFITGSFGLVVGAGLGAGLLHPEPPSPAPNPKPEPAITLAMLLAKPRGGGQSPAPNSSPMRRGIFTCSGLPKIPVSRRSISISPRRAASAGSLMPRPDWALSGGRRPVPARCCIAAASLDKRAQDRAWRQRRADALGDAGCRSCPASGLVIFIFSLAFFGQQFLVHFGDDSAHDLVAAPGAGPSSPAWWGMAGRSAGWLLGQTPQAGCWTMDSVYTPVLAIGRLAASGCGLRLICVTVAEIAYAVVSRPARRIGE